MDRRTIVMLATCMIGGAAIAACQPAADSASSPLTDDGTYLVGEQIQPGTYAVSPDAETAYWARCSDVACDPFSSTNPSVILNEIPTGPSFLVIEPTDVAVQLRSVTLEGPK